MAAKRMKTTELRSSQETDPAFPVTYKEKEILEILFLCTMNLHAEFLPTISHVCKTFKCGPKFAITNIGYNNLIHGLYDYIHIRSKRFSLNSHFKTTFIVSL